MKFLTRFLPGLPEMPLTLRLSLLWFFTKGWAKLNRVQLGMAALFAVWGLFGALDPFLGAGIAFALTVTTLGGGGSATGSITASVGAVITVLTMPATADYTYEVDMHCVPSGGSAAATGLLIWGGAGVQPGDYGGSSDARPQPGTQPSASATAVAAGNIMGSRFKMKVGPSTPVTVAYWNWTTQTPTYFIAYNYIGYKIT